MKHSQNKTNATFAEILQRVFPLVFKDSLKNNNFTIPKEWIVLAKKHCKEYKTGVSHGDAAQIYRGQNEPCPGYAQCLDNRCRVATLLYFKIGLLLANDLHTKHWRPCKHDNKRRICQRLFCFQKLRDALIAVLEGAVRPHLAYPQLHRKESLPSISDESTLTEFMNILMLDAEVKEKYQPFPSWPGMSPHEASISKQTFQRYVKKVYQCLAIYIEQQLRFQIKNDNFINEYHLEWRLIEYVELFKATLESRTDKTTSLSESYVSPPMVDSASSDPIIEQSLLQQQDNIWITGDWGSGKTTLLQYLGLNSDSTVFPIWITDDIIRQVNESTSFSAIVILSLNRLSGKQQSLKYWLSLFQLQEKIWIFIDLKNSNIPKHLLKTFVTFGRVLIASPEIPPQIRKVIDNGDLGVWRHIHIPSWPQHKLRSIASKKRITSPQLEAVLVKWKQEGIPFYPLYLDYLSHSVRHGDNFSTLYRLFQSGIQQKMGFLEKSTRRKYHRELCKIAWLSTLDQAKPATALAKKVQYWAYGAGLVTDTHSSRPRFTYALFQHFLAAQDFARTEPDDIRARLFGILHRSDMHILLSFLFISWTQERRWKLIEHLLTTIHSFTTLTFSVRSTKSAILMLANLAIPLKSAQELYSLPQEITSQNKRVISHLRHIFQKLLVQWIKEDKPIFLTPVAIEKLPLLLSVFETQDLPDSLIKDISNILIKAPVIVFGRSTPAPPPKRMQEGVQLRFQLELSQRSQVTEKDILRLKQLVKAQMLSPEFIWNMGMTGQFKKTEIIQALAASKNPRIIDLLEHHLTSSSLSETEFENLCASWPDERIELLPLICATYKHRDHYTNSQLWRTYGQIFLKYVSLEEILFSILSQPIPDDLFLFFLQHGTIKQKNNPELIKILFQQIISYDRYRDTWPLSHSDRLGQSIADWLFRLIFMGAPPLITQLSTDDLLLFIENSTIPPTERFQIATVLAERQHTERIHSLGMQLLQRDNNDPLLLATAIHLLKHADGVLLQNWMQNSDTKVVGASALLAHRSGIDDLPLNYLKTNWPVGKRPEQASQNLIWDIIMPILDHLSDFSPQETIPILTELIQKELDYYSTHHSSLRMEQMIQNLGLPGMTQELVDNLSIFPQEMVTSQTKFLWRRNDYLSFAILSGIGTPAHVQYLLKHYEIHQDPLIRVIIRNHLRNPKSIPVLAEWLRDSQNDDIRELTAACLYYTILSGTAPIETLTNVFGILERCSTDYPFPTNSYCHDIIRFTYITGVWRK